MRGQREVFSPTPGGLSGSHRGNRAIGHSGIKLLAVWATLEATGTLGSLLTFSPDDNLLLLLSKPPDPHLSS